MRSIFTAAMIAASLVPAAASASSFSADFGTAPKGKIIARDVLWACDGAACVGSTDYSRPLIVCQSLAKKVGPIAAFKVDGRALAADDLARCNAGIKAAKASNVVAN